MNRRDFTKTFVGVAAVLVAGQKAFAADDPGVQELSAAFVEGVREVAPLTWSRQVEAVGHSWLEDRLSGGTIEYLNVRASALRRARELGRETAKLARAEGKAEIQVRHFHEALRPMADDCPFGNYQGSAQVG